jgi:hypothetical protein
VRRGGNALYPPPSRPASIGVGACWVSVTRPSAPPGAAARRAAAPALGEVVDGLLPGGIELELRVGRLQGLVDQRGEPCVRQAVVAVGLVAGPFAESAVLVPGEALAQQAPFPPAGPAHVPSHPAVGEGQVGPAALFQEVGQRVAGQGIACRPLPNCICVLAYSSLSGTSRLRSTSAFACLPAPDGRREMTRHDGLEKQKRGPR